MIDDESLIFSALSEAIQATVKEFHAFPLDFLSERDIQAVLFAKLRQLTPNLRYRYEANGKNSHFGFSKLTGTEPFHVHPVTTEYYLYNDRRQDRFDVAVLSSKPDSDAAIWRQPCRVGIEIKLWQPGYRDCRYQDDVKKLLNYRKYLQDNFNGEERRFTGLAMVFVHPCVEKKWIEGFFDSLEENSIAAYPEDCVVLHGVTGWKDEKQHQWKQFPPS